MTATASKKRARLNPTFRKILSITAIVYIALCIVLFFYQRELIYFPTAQIEHNQTRFSLKNEGETLEIIVLNEGQEQAIIYFGGNNEAVAQYAQIHINNFPKHSVYLANYRGYGGSTGDPTEQGLYSDALALFDQISIKHQYIHVIGRSLGTGVATYVAANRNIQKLVLVTPFDSIEELAKSQYPMFPISLLLQDTFDSFSRAALIKVPTLIVVAQKDKIIPTENSLRLIREFNPQRLKVKAFKSAGHNNVTTLGEYHAVLTQFIK